MYTKIAKRIKKSKKEDKITAKDLALGPGLFLGGNTAGLVLAAKPDKEHLKDFKLSYEEAARMYGLDPKDFYFEEPEGKLQSQYIPKEFSPFDKNVIMAPENHPILLHEMSHAESLGDGKKALQKLKILGYAGGRLVGIPLGFALGYYSKDLKKEDKKYKDWQGRALTALAVSPVLYEETKANIRALNRLRKMKKLNSKTILPLIGSELTYLSLLGTYDTGRILKKYLDD